MNLTDPVPRGMRSSFFVFRLCGNDYPMNAVHRPDTIKAKGREGNKSKTLMSVLIRARRSPALMVTTPPTAEKSDVISEKGFPSIREPAAEQQTEDASDYRCRYICQNSYWHSVLKSCEKAMVD